jgi:hypothetical protein
MEGLIYSGGKMFLPCNCKCCQEREGMHRQITKQRIRFCEDNKVLKEALQQIFDKTGIVVEGKETEQLQRISIIALDALNAVQKSKDI